MFQSSTIGVVSKWWCRSNSATRRRAMSFLSSSSSSYSSSAVIQTMLQQQKKLVRSSLSLSARSLAVHAATLDKNQKSTVLGSTSTSTTSSTLLLAAAALVLGGVATTSTTTTTSDCEESQVERVVTPAAVAKEYNQNLNDTEESTESELLLPVYTAQQVAQHNGTDHPEIWMSYGGMVYNVTQFIANHPGGSEKILMAAGQAMEPYWNLYQQHYASQLPMLLMEKMVIGQLDPNDQQAVDDSMEELQIQQGDPYQHEPALRHKALRVHSDKPMNAETPSHLLTHQWCTPNSLFYIRHHHPVPYLTPKQVQNYKLVIDVSAYCCAPTNKQSNHSNANNGILRLSLDQLKALPKTEITATLQCSGNRRGGYNVIDRTTGTTWGQGAISTATFGGVLLKDLLHAAGMHDLNVAQDQFNLNHVQFDALDGMISSIPIDKAANPTGDVLVAYEMNGTELPRDHGYPVRIIVPGYAAVRSVKWVRRIALQSMPATGPWMQGLNYKILPPNVTDANTVNLEEMPSVMEASVYSAITQLHLVDASHVAPGDRVTVRASGWAWAGGGRSIVRVDVTGNGGTTTTNGPSNKDWTKATLTEGHLNQRPGRAWAWTFWTAEIPDCIVREDGTVHVACKAVDAALNTQPQDCQHSWNVRGLGNNSWYRAQIRVCAPEHI